METGDKVVIVGGPLDGEEGVIKEIGDGVVHVAVQGEKDLISIVPDVDCKPAPKKKPA